MPYTRRSTHIANQYLQFLIISAEFCMNFNISNIYYNTANYIF